MILICPGCSGIDIDLLRDKFKEEKIVCGCIGECSGRVDESIVAFVNNIFVEAKNQDDFIRKVNDILNQ